MAKKGQKIKTIDEETMLKIVKEKIDKGKSYLYLSKNIIFRLEQSRHG